MEALIFALFFMFFIYIRKHLNKILVALAVLMVSIGLALTIAETVGWKTDEPSGIVQQQYGKSDILEREK